MRFVSRLYTKTIKKRWFAAAAVKQTKSKYSGSGCLQPYYGETQYFLSYSVERKVQPLFRGGNQAIPVPKKETLRKPILLQRHLSRSTRNNKDCLKSLI